MAEFEKCMDGRRRGDGLAKEMKDLMPLTNPWPLAQWGLDIVGPMPMATGKRKFLLVGTKIFHQVD